MILSQQLNGKTETLDKKLNKFQFLTGNMLKIIALVTMLFDHICKIVFQWLLNNYWVKLYDTGQMTWEKFSEIDNFIRFALYAIGTIAFPLFCFLLSEGFYYTKNRKQYISLMLIFAIISELPFDLGFFSELSSKSGTFPFYWAYQNVYFTLFLGLIALMCLERFSFKLIDNKTTKIKALPLQVISVATISVVAKMLHCDYGVEGIFFIVAFYICREKRIYQVIFFLLVYMVTTGNQPTIYVMLSCLLILFYNGKRGKLKLKYCFYMFYPAHILILYLITLLLGRLLII